MKIEPINIEGVDCELTTDENEFFDVFILGEKIPQELSAIEVAWRTHTGEILMPEWIVRGAVGRETALDRAAQSIKARRAGYSLSHNDAEGLVKAYKIALSREEFERIFNASGL